MSCHMPFLVNSGNFPDNQLFGFCSSLSNSWGGSLLKYSVYDDPRKTLESLQEDQGLVQLIGDPGISHPSGANWIEALGAWKQPTILIATPTPKGEIPGTAMAYTALCREFSVPLLGLVQYGGCWDPDLRKLDGLPWCGWLPESLDRNPNENNLIEESFSVDEIIFILRQRLKNTPR